MTTEHTDRKKDEPGGQRHPGAPADMTPGAWKDILWRTWGEISDDRITLVAAGATYYLLLALFPTVVAFVSLYGLLTDASTVNQHVGMLSGIVPAGGMEIIDEELTRLTQQRTGNAGFGSGDIPGDRPLEFKLRHQDIVRGDEYSQ